MRPECLWAATAGAVPEPPPSELRRRYREGHTRFGQRDDAEAVAAFDAVARAGAFLPYSRFYRGTARLRAGDTAAAEADLVWVLRESAREGLDELAARSLLLLAEARILVRRPGEAAATVREFLSRRTTHPLDISSLARAEHRRRVGGAWELLGRALALAGDRRGAIEALMVAGWGYGEGPSAAFARAHLRRLRNRSVRERDLPAAAHLGRAERALADGRPDLALGELEAALRGSALDPAAAAEAWFFLGFLRYRDAPAPAAAAFRRSVSSGGGAVALTWEGRALARAGRSTEAVEVAERLEQVDRVWAGRLWLDLAYRAEAQGLLQEARVRLSRAAQAAPETRAADEARWRLGWLDWQEGKRDEARRVWLSAARGHPRTWRAPAALFWAARASADPADAETLLREAADASPWTFYGQIARERLGRPPSVPPPGLSLARPAVSPGRLEALPRELAALGFDDDAVDAASASGDLETLIPALFRLGRIWEAVRVADTQLPQRTDLVTLAYPDAFARQVREAARAVGLDPHLLWAVAREESKFDSRAVSIAGAIGLTQLLPRTAQSLTGEVLTPALLMDSRRNLRLGALYLARQRRRYGDTVLALAAYNAGPRAAARLRGTLPLSDLAEATERIPIPETRRYVQRVLESQAIYRLLHP